MELPNGWVSATLADFGQWSSGGTPSRKRVEYFGGDIPWVLTGDLDDGTVHRVPNSLTSEGIKNSSAKTFPKGTLLVAMYGATIGKLGILGIEAATNQACAALLPSNANVASLPFIYYFLLAQRSNLRKAGKGGAQPNISQTVLKNLSIPVPPLNEQHRIVEKIETLFVRIDKGEEALREVQKLLKRYRQSILKAAVTGELTRDWREANQPKLEPASDLLARILETRRDNWQGRGKYKKAIEPDATYLPNLPANWQWASLGQLLYGIEAGKNYRCLERPPNGDEFGIVKISAVTWEEFDEDESKTITDANRVSLQHLIKAGDLLMSRANTIELVGASVVVDRITKQLQLSDKVLRLKLVAPLENWINTVLRSPIGRKQIEMFATGAQMSMRNISQKNIERIAIPLPSHHEIDAISAVVGSCFNKGRNLKSICEAELTRSYGLRQSILKSAFTGQLVPQDPNDEPAAELLARIHAEREATPKKKSRRKAGA